MRAIVIDLDLTWQQVAPTSTLRKRVLREAIMPGIPEKPRTHAAIPGETTRLGRQEPERDYDDGLLSVAGPIMALAYGLALAILLVTFDGDTEALFSVSIVTGVFLISFVLPTTMMWTRRRQDARWHHDAELRSSRDVVTWTGSFQRHEALIQIVIIPLAVAIAFSCFALIWLLEGP
jgi:hypothetical protein